MKPAIYYRAAAFMFAVALAAYLCSPSAAAFQAFLTLFAYLLGRGDGWDAFWEINNDAVVRGAERDAKARRLETGDS